MDINKFIDSIENELFNRIRNSKSDAEARRLLKEHQALQLLQPDVIKSVCKHEYITDANWKSLTCRLCNDRIKPTQTVL